ncbi:hypothetical protein SGM_6019 [Streptomyces griseoaurantiacus M045]|uniref:Uncharacterized protein n=1 Tax=Streptomyces griseoaurantiacus M045 TaxID=996637 RepID=F3NSA5_9ACTN|nr:hypothetical protein SGM_6019 [Streptomyces griseoaurantiacus M045]
MVDSQRLFLSRRAPRAARADIPGRCGAIRASRGGHCRALRYR